MPVQISLHSPAPPDLLAVVDDGLDTHNQSLAALQDVRPLHGIATDLAGEVAGGAIGRTWGLCCELQQLWVAPEWRNRGIGTQLLEAYELAAGERGCDTVFLDSFSFQAPRFYEQRGYEELSRLSGFADGIVKYTLRKWLNEARRS